MRSQSPIAPFVRSAGVVLAPTALAATDKSGNDAVRTVVADVAIR